jgi:hypothetical protein
MSKSPTQRSLEEMRKRGYFCWVVEYWHSFSKTRRDLWGFADLLCLREGEVVAVQTTSASHVAERIKKIADHENVGHVRKAGVRILVHGWDGAKLREVDVS